MDIDELQKKLSALNITLNIMMQGEESAKIILTAFRDNVGCARDAYPKWLYNALKKVPYNERYMYQFFNKLYHTDNINVQQQLQTMREHFAVFSETIELSINDIDLESRPKIREALQALVDNAQKNRTTKTLCRSKSLQTAFLTGDTICIDYKAFFDNDIRDDPSFIYLLRNMERHTIVACIMKHLTQLDEHVRDDIMSIFPQYTDMRELFNEMCKSEEHAYIAKMFCEAICV